MIKMLKLTAVVFVLAYDNHGIHLFRILLTYFLPNP